MRRVTMTGNGIWFQTELFSGHLLVCPEAIKSLWKLPPRCKEITVTIRKTKPAGQNYHTLVPDESHWARRWGIDRKTLGSGPKDYLVLPSVGRWLDEQFPNAEKLYVELEA